MDTDFLSKTIVSRNDELFLAQKMVSLLDFEFVCHEKIIDEINNSTNNDLKNWIKKQISCKKINVYDDEIIINALDSIGINGKVMFINLMIESLRAFCDNTIINRYAQLHDFVLETNSIFCSEIFKIESDIANDRDIGEKKTILLLQVLRYLGNDEIIIFCSDDKRARNVFLTFDGIAYNASCLTVLSLFYIFRKRINEDKLKVYYDSYTNYFAENGQTSFKVRKNEKLIPIEFEKIFNGIISDEFVLDKLGILSYK